MRTRREWITSLPLLPVAFGLARNAQAQTTGKITQAAAQYQDTPKNGQVCGMCKYYIAPGGQAGAGMMGGGQRGPGMMAQAGTCQVVEGSISARGWCVLYAPLGS